MDEESENEHPVRVRFTWWGHNLSIIQGIHIPWVNFFRTTKLTKLGWLQLIGNNTNNILAQLTEHCRVRVVNPHEELIKMYY